MSSEETTPEQPGAPLVDSERLEGAVEAVLMAADRPLPAARIARALQIEAPEGAPRSESGSERIKGAVEALNTVYEQTGRSFRIELLAGGYRVMTLPEYAPAVGGLMGLRDSQKLSRAALETLAIIAYRQPITRAELETIRGVGCGEVVRTLLEKRLIAIVGRAEELGRPMLYGTSRRFLEIFGLGSLRDLPAVADVLPPQMPTATDAAEDEEAEPTPATPEVRVRQKEAAEPAEPAT